MVKPPTPAPIRVGIGGWTYEPWRGSFYPKGLPHAKELEHASRHVTSIEVNGTFYRLQTPKTFRAWAEATPEGFVFSLKAPRYVVNRKELATAGPAIAKFLESGLTELGRKLGPILWQLAPTKKLDLEDLEAFLALLPREQDGVRLRHALEVRHASFLTPDFVALLRRHGVAVVLEDDEDHPMIADLTADFFYARLRRAVEEEPAGYAPDALDLWAERCRTWARGDEPDGLPRIGEEPAPAQGPRSCFVYFINGAKVRAPSAAMALIERLGGRHSD